MVDTTFAEQQTRKVYDSPMDKNMAAQIRRNNLRRWMETRQPPLSLADLARRIGSGRAYASLLFREDRHFGEKAARSIESSLHLPEGYLDSIQQQPTAVAAWETPDDLDADVFALVPRVEVSLSAGNGRLVDSEQPLPPLAFRRDWLRRKGVTGRANLRICNINGRSMEPFLADGDVVLIDTGQTAIHDGEIYAVRYGDEIKIKRLFKTLDGGIRLHSDNPEFPDEVVRPGPSFGVIGMKIWRGG